VYIGGLKFLAPDVSEGDHGDEQQHCDAEGREPANARRPCMQVFREEGGSLTAIGVVCFFVIIFWAVYEQSGNTVQLFAVEHSDMMMLPGLKMPATWIQSLNPFFILVLIPVTNKFWTWQESNGTEPSSVRKMAIGCLISAGSFALMVAAAAFSDDAKGSDGGGTCSVWWLVAAIFILTVGEIYASPIGLSFVTKAAPVELLSALMGLWFLGSAAGGYLAGEIGAWYGSMGKAQFFLLVAVIGLVNGGLMMLAVPFVMRRTKDGEGTEEGENDSRGGVVEVPL